MNVLYESFLSYWSAVKTDRKCIFYGTTQALRAKLFYCQENEDWTPNFNLKLNVEQETLDSWFKDVENVEWRDTEKPHRNVEGFLLNSSVRGALLKELGYPDTVDVTDEKILDRVAAHLRKPEVKRRYNAQLTEYRLYDLPLLVGGVRKMYEESETDSVTLGLDPVNFRYKYRLLLECLNSANKKRKDSACAELAQEVYDYISSSGKPGANNLVYMPLMDLLPGKIDDFRDEGRRRDKEDIKDTYWDKANKNKYVTLKYKGRFAEAVQYIKDGRFDDDVDALNDPIALQALFHLENRPRCKILKMILTAASSMSKANANTNDWEKLMRRILKDQSRPEVAEATKEDISKLLELLEENLETSNVPYGLFKIHKLFPF